MALATATLNGIPSLRYVLYKGTLEQRICFYTNYDSQKSRELDANPRASLAFFWPTAFMQVRVVGSVEKLSSSQSDAYFASRPFLSQLAAVASNQSKELSSFDQLEQKFAGLKKNYSPTRPIPRPKNWGGYGLSPSYFEFWYGRENRMHHRRAFTKGENGLWTDKILSP